MSEPNAIVQSYDRSPALLRPVAKPAELIAAHDEAAAVITGVLKEGRDYGNIPGTERPTLLKPGAESVTIAFGCFADYEIMEREADHDREIQWSKRKKEWEGGSPVWRTQTGTSLGLYRYVVKCRLIHRQSGEVVGSGIGVCSSVESKYIDRPRDCENTVLKMAEKRGHVAAVLNTFGLSDRFTQDVEDIKENAAAGKVESEPESPKSYLHLQRAVTKPEDKEATAYMKACGMSKEQYSTLFDASKLIDTDVRFVLLEAKAKGVKDPVEIIRLADPEYKPAEAEQKAENPTGLEGESTTTSAPKPASSAPSSPTDEPSIELTSTERAQFRTHCRALGHENDAQLLQQAAKEGCTDLETAMQYVVGLRKGVKA